MDADILADLRADATEELTGNGDGTTATVYNHVKTDTPLGGQTSTYTAGNTYPCVLQAGARIPRETLQGAEITSIADYTAKLPWDAVIDVTGRLKIGNNFYEILAFNGDQTERLTLEVNLKVPNA